MEKPAGIGPPANQPEVKMLTHLLLLLIVVILDVKVKVVIGKKR